MTGRVTATRPTTQDFQDRKGSGGIMKIKEALGNGCLVKTIVGGGGGSKFFRLQTGENSLKCEFRGRNGGAKTKAF